MTEITKTLMAKLLAVCARFDGRVLDGATFESWFELLADIPYEDIDDAIRTHYRTSEKWIMPAHIVAHHEKLEAARQVEAARQSPPGCWGCPQVYKLSDRAGSKFALPAGPHDPSCRAMQGVLVFDGASDWNVMQVDPAVFDEELWEQTHRAVTARRQAYLELNGGAGE
jgi:hypothetical protein